VQSRNAKQCQLQGRSFQPSPTSDFPVNRNTGRALLHLPSTQESTVKTPRTPIVRTLAALAVAGSLITFSVQVLSQSVTNDKAPTAADTADRQTRMHERASTRLERMAQRLKIEASQQAAWDAYARTVEGMFGTGGTKPPADADAATLVRLRAQRAAEHAQKLNQLADATATLQQSLNPEQRKTLNEIARRGPHEHHAQQPHSR
jgi:hypothetical protein